MLTVEQSARPLAFGNGAQVNPRQSVGVPSPSGLPTSQGVNSSSARSSPPSLIEILASAATAGFGW